MNMFPSWLTYDNKRAIFRINGDVYYPQILRELGVVEVDQYWLEVAYQCAKLDAMRYIMLAGVDPRPNKVLILDIKVADKEKWALRNHPVGRGIEAASKGREAREHYKKLRGFLPE